MEPKNLCLFLFLCLLPVLVVAAFVIPMFASVPKIPPGLSREDELVAEYALNQVRLESGGPLGLIIRGTKVISIQKKPGETKIYLPDPKKEEGVVYYTFQNAYNVEVKIYTFFGFNWAIWAVNTEEGSQSTGPPYPEEGSLSIGP